MKIKHRSGPSPDKPNYVQPLVVAKQQKFESAGFSDVDKYNQIISQQLEKLHTSSCGAEQARLSFEDLKKLQILGEELRAMHKFEQSLDLGDQLSNLSNEELAEMLRSRSNGAK